MTPQDDASRSSPEEEKPLLPQLDFLDLSDEEARRFQEILERQTGRSWKFGEAKFRGIELLELAALLIDPIGWSYWRKNPPELPDLPTMSPPAPTPPAVPRPSPISLDADHDREIDRALAMLVDELAWVKRRPTAWRWALVALYNALGHVLAKHRPAGFHPHAGLGQVTILFDVVAKRRPEITPDRKVVEVIDRLRTTWIAQPVTRWPTLAGELPVLWLACLRTIRHLEPKRTFRLDRAVRLLGRSPYSP